MNDDPLSHGLRNGEGQLVASASWIGECIAQALLKMLYEVHDREAEVLRGTWLPGIGDGRIYLDATTNKLNLVALPGIESPQRSLFSEAGRSAQLLTHVSACHELFFHANGERLQFLRLLEQPVGNLEEAMKLLAQAGHREDWVKKLVALSVGREVPLQIGSRTVCIGGATDVPAGMASGQTEILPECLARPTKDHEKWRITTACTGARIKSRRLTGLTASRPAVEATLRLAYLADTPLQLTLRAVESTMKAGGYYLIEEARLLSDPRPYIENLFRVAASG